MFDKKLDRFYILSFLFNADMTYNVIHQINKRLSFLLELLGHNLYRVHREHAGASGNTRGQHFGLHSGAAARRPTSSF